MTIADYRRRKATKQHQTTTTNTIHWSVVIFQFWIKITEVQKLINYEFIICVVALSAKSNNGIQVFAISL